MHSFKKAAAAVAIAGLMLPAAAFADTSSSSVQTLLDQLKSLQAQIQSVQQQQQTILGQLAVTLNVGSQGDNVKLLQQLLAQDSSIYPEGTISGFFGPRTAAAVKRFQKRHGLEQAGRVGPQTLKLLNQLFGHNGNPGNSTGTTTVGQKENDNDKDDHNSKKPCVQQPSILGFIGFLKGHDERSDRYDLPCVATSTPDTVVPVISAVSATSITTGGATIVWTTNENSTSQVEYGTTSSYGATTALNSSLVTLHSVVLTGLTANTTYNFRVWSKDASNNSATSANMTFTTSAVDATAPVLSSIVSSAVATTTATVSWNTNESATGKVYFGTVNPLVLASAATQSSATPATTHSFALTGLTASTTYFYVVESADAANNTSTSSQGTFTTTN